MTSGKPQIMARMTPKTAMCLWLIFGGIFAAFALSTLLSTIGSAGLIQTIRLIVALVFVMISGVYFRNAWNAYRDSRNRKE